MNMKPSMAPKKFRVQNGHQELLSEHDDMIISPRNKTDIAQDRHDTKNSDVVNLLIDNEETRNHQIQAQNTQGEDEKQTNLKIEHALKNTFTNPQERNEFTPNKTVNIGAFSVDNTLIHEREVRDNDSYLENTTNFDGLTELAICEGEF